MNFYKSLETWLHNIFPFIDKDNITLILTIVGLVVPVILTGFNHFIKYINYDSFDLKLLHKKNQTFIPFIRNTFFIGILTIAFFIISFCFTLIVINISILENILAFIMLGIFLIIGISPIVYLIDPIIFIVKKFFTKNNPRFIISPYFKSKINKNPTFFYISSIILITLITVTEMVVIHSNMEKNENIFDVIKLSDCFFILVFCVFPSLILFMHTYLTKRKYFYNLIEVSNELPKQNLYLDYFLNDNTSVLYSEDKLYKVIKKSEGENQIYEVYEKIERKDNENE